MNKRYDVTCFYEKSKQNDILNKLKQYNIRPILIYETTLYIRNVGYIKSIIIDTILLRLCKHISRTKNIIDNEQYKLLLTSSRASKSNNNKI